MQAYLLLALPCRLAQAIFDLLSWTSAHHTAVWLVVLFTLVISSWQNCNSRIGSVLEERRAKLDEDVASAFASGDAARVGQNMKPTLTPPYSRSETTKQAAAEATKQAEASDAKIAKKLAEKVAKAEAKLDIARSEALANLNNVAAEAAMAAVAQLADIQTTAAQAGKAADKLAKHMAKQETN